MLNMTQVGANWNQIIVELNNWYILGKETEISSSYA